MFLNEFGCLPTLVPDWIPTGSRLAKSGAQKCKIDARLDDATLTSLHVHLQAQMMLRWRLFMCTCGLRRCYADDFSCVPAGLGDATLTTLFLYLGVVGTRHPSKAYVDTTWPTENGRNWERYKRAIPCEDCFQHVCLQKMEVEMVRSLINILNTCWILASKHNDVKTSRCAWHHSETCIFQRNNSLHHFTSKPTHSWTWSSSSRRRCGLGSFGIWSSNYRWGEASWQPSCSHLFTILALSEAKLQKKSQRKVATNDLQPSEAKPERAPQALKMASILTCCWILVP